MHSLRFFNEQVKSNRLMFLNADGAWSESIQKIE